MERTRITTMQITHIEKVDEKQLLTLPTNKEQFAKVTAEVVKHVLGADDVVITNVQDFERDDAEEV